MGVSVDWLPVLGTLKWLFKFVEMYFLVLLRCHFAFLASSSAGYEQKLQSKTGFLIFCNHQTNMFSMHEHNLYKSNTEVWHLHPHSFYSYTILICLHQSVCLAMTAVIQSMRSVLFINGKIWVPKL